jgi:hypothetical protein
MEGSRWSATRRCNSSVVVPGGDHDLLVTKSAHGIDAQGASGRQQCGQDGDQGKYSYGAKIGDGIEIADAVEHLTQDTDDTAAPPISSSNPAMTGRDN